MSLPDKVNILLKLATENFALSRHYEQMQYAIMAALIAGIGAMLSNRSIAQKNGRISRTYILFVGFVFSVLVVLQVRFLSLSIMQFHHAQTQINIATELMAGNQSAINNYPFDIDMNNRALTKTPYFVQWLITVTAPFYMLYALPATLIIFGLVAMVAFIRHKPASPP